MASNHTETIKQVPCDYSAVRSFTLWTRLSYERDINPFSGANDAA